MSSGECNFHLVNSRHSELRDELGRVQRDFLEADLSLAATFVDIAKRRYEDGESQKADWSKRHAEAALRTVRYFIATTSLLSGAVVDSLAQRCDELEQILARLEQAK
jgi:hypothetical protein